MDKTLIEALRCAGRETLPLQFADGSEILVLPYGGRVLGLFADGSADNFLWTNPALANIESARAFYASGEWANSGGDRTWLAPEIDFFLPKFPDLSAYHHPRSLDPGAYAAEVGAGKITLKMDFPMTPKSTGATVNLRLSKTLSSSPDPLGTTCAQYAGFELATTLEALSPISTGIGIWSLLQLPSGGEMIVPTYRACRPLIVFGQPPFDDLEIGERELRYRMSADGDHKISIRASCVTGRIGYIYESRAESHLIVRNFSVNPSGDYVDAGWNDPSDTGHCVQACNVNGVYGTFSEMEYHAPAISAMRPQVTDSSQVWAYRARKEQIWEIARQLLGTSRRRYPRIEMSISGW